MDILHQSEYLHNLEYTSILPKSTQYIVWFDMVYNLYGQDGGGFEREQRVDCSPPWSFFSSLFDEFKIYFEGYSINIPICPTPLNKFQIRLWVKNIKKKKNLNFNRGFRNIILLKVW